VLFTTNKGKMVPLQARCGPEGGYRCSSTLPWPRHLKGVSAQQHAPAALYPREGPGTHFTGGWRGENLGPHRDSIPDRIYYKWCGVIIYKVHVMRNTDAIWCNLCNRMDSIKLIQYSSCTQQWKFEELKGVDFQFPLSCSVEFSCCSSVVKQVV